ncbi:MAG: hypothetical protein WC054_02980 [Candidatus Nanopelagicales bacterium]
MEQLAITGDGDVGASASKRRSPTKSRAKKSIELATSQPVAEVVVDINAAALDHPFDFSVPAKFDSIALPGSRVRVRFAGRLVNGFILSRRDRSEHHGKLTPLAGVLGPAVLTPEIAALGRAVADRYAGTLSEVLRDAIPNRHARTEAKFTEAGGAFVAGEVNDPDPQRRRIVDWDAYVNGLSVVDDLQAGRQVRASLVVSTADEAAHAIADLVGAAGRRAVVVAPDATDVARLGDYLEKEFGSTVVRLTGDQPVAARYESFLRVRSGAATVVVGTRNSVFAPVSDAPLVIVWDDLDDSLGEVRAPGWHAREVAALRSLSSASSLVIAGYTRSVESAKLVEQGWLRGVEPTREQRHRGPAIRTAASARMGDPAAGARIPRFAWEVISDGLARGPVLVQVGRRGYLARLSCANCHELATCLACSGPLVQDAAGEALRCRWCAAAYPEFACPACAKRSWRAVAIGSVRSAQELAAAFPAVKVVVSDSESGIIPSVPNSPAIVVSTVGAEPQASDRYAAAVLLDGDAQLGSAHLRSGEQLVRRWFNAAALIRAADAGGQIAVTADPASRAVQALVRGDAAAWATRELAERRETALPPVVRSAQIAGSQARVEEFIAACAFPSDWRILGPTPQLSAAGTQPGVQIVVLTPTAEGPVLAARIKAALVADVTRSGTDRVSVRLDPLLAL